MKRTDHLSGNKENTVTRVRKIVEPIAVDLGLRIWDVRYVKEGASWFLRIFLDHDDGISIDDCERFSRAIDKPLDDADPIEDSYYLEVSSPGLGRELISPEHFEAMTGQEVKIKLIRPRDGIREFIGVLSGLTGDVIKLDIDGREVEFIKSETSKVKLNDDEF